MAEHFDLKAFSDAITRLVADAAPSIVSVHSHRSRASGFVWRDGLIVTADETLAEEGDIAVGLADGTNVPATLAGRDHTTDIALLRIDGTGGKPASFATSATAAGALTITVGRDQGSPVVASGVVAVAGPAWRSMRGGDIDARIALDLRLRRVAEGGLTLDATGQALGMAVRGPRQTLVIPHATIERVATKLAAHGRIARGYLGLALQPVRIEGGVGVIVMTVEAGGPGAAADNTPTIVTNQKMLCYRDFEAATSAADMRLVPRFYRDVVWHPNLGRLNTRISRDYLDRQVASCIDKKKQLTRKLFDAGAKIFLGTDVAQPFLIPGKSLQEEMANFVDAGISAEAVWKLATRDAGARLGQPGLGVIEEGAPADLLLFRNDPTQSLANLASLEAVVAGGVLYRMDDLQHAIDCNDAYYSAPLIRAAANRGAKRALASAFGDKPARPAAPRRPGLPETL